MNASLWLALAVIGMNIFAASFGLISPTLTGAAIIEANVSLTILPPDTCALDLTQGWNLVSICANVTNTTIASIFNETYSNILFVLDWNESLQQFTVFSPLQISPPFTALNMTKSYFVFYNNALNATEDIDVRSFTELNISLIQNYNAPSYPYEFPMNISKYVGSIVNSTGFVLLWNASGQRFINFSPTDSNPPITHIDSGDGQFIFITAPGGANLSYVRDSS